MNKGIGSINDYKKGNNSAVSEEGIVRGKSCAAEQSVSESALNHSSAGEYNTIDRPKSGGHGQESIDYMDAHGIPYEINEEYNNGVRAGNMPNHKKPMFHSGNKHTWFPKSWTRQDIKTAGEYVASRYKGQRVLGAKHSAIYNKVKVAVIFGNHGEVCTVFPSADQPGGKKK